MDAAILLKLLGEGASYMGERKRLDADERDRQEREKTKKTAEDDKKKGEARQHLSLLRQNILMDKMLRHQNPGEYQKLIDTHNAECNNYGFNELKIYGMPEDAYEKAMISDVTGRAETNPAGAEAYAYWQYPTDAERVIGVMKKRNTLAAGDLPTAQPVPQPQPRPTPPPMPMPAPAVPQAVAPAPGVGPMADMFRTQPQPQAQPMAGDLANVQQAATQAASPSIPQQQIPTTGSALDVFAGGNKNKAARAKQAETAAKAWIGLIRKGYEPEKAVLQFSAQFPDDEMGWAQIIAGTTPDAPKAVPVTQTSTYAYNRKITEINNILKRPIKDQATLDASRSAMKAIKDEWYSTKPLSDYELPGAVDRFLSATAGATIQSTSRSRGGGGRGGGGGGHRGGGDNAGGGASDEPDARAKAMKLNAEEKRMAGFAHFNSFAVLHAPQRVREVITKKGTYWTKDKDGDYTLNNRGKERVKTINEEEAALHGGGTSNSAEPVGKTFSGTGAPAKIKEYVQKHRSDSIEKLCINIQRQNPGWSEEAIYNEVMKHR